MTTIQILTLLEMVLMMVPKITAGWTTIMDLIRRGKAGEAIPQEELDEALGKVLLASAGWDNTPNPNKPGSVVTTDPVEDV